MVDIQRSCRTCMKSINTVTPIDLFQTVKIEEGRDVELHRALVECTNTQISRDDGLPQNICNECLELLQVSFIFRNQAINADSEFRRMIFLKSEVKTEVDIDLDDIDITDNFESTHNDYEDSLLDVKSFSKNYECVKCNKNFKSEKRYLKHLNNHENVFPCHVCSKKFYKQSALNKHVLKHNVQITYDPNVDTETSEALDLAQNPMPDGEKVEIKIEFEDEGKFKCEMCDMVFAKSRSLAMHKKKHKKKSFVPDAYICDICKKEYSSKGLLRRHLKCHFDGLRYSCTKCSRSYSRRDQLNLHMKKHENIKLNTCTYCNKSFAQMCSLKDHLRIHTQETPYLCAECGKGFKSHSNLRQHIIRHTGIKPYNCSLCPKTFATKGQMLSHLSTHTNAHPFSCEQCGAAFTKLNSLKKHSLIHSGVRPFVCDECDMRFICKDHLKRHQRTHTGEKPYKCAHCERAFSQSNDLIKHTRSHIGQNVYQCTVCDMKFRLYTELKQHYPTHYVNVEAPTIPIGNSEYPVLMNRNNPDSEHNETKVPMGFEKNIINAFNRTMLDKSVDNNIVCIDSVIVNEKT